MGYTSNSCSFYGTVHHIGPLLSRPGQCVNVPYPFLSVPYFSDKTVTGTVVLYNICFLSGLGLCFHSTFGSTSRVCPFSPGSIPLWATGTKGSRVPTQLVPMFESTELPSLKQFLGGASNLLSGFLCALFDHPSGSANPVFSLLSCQWFLGLKDFSSFLCSTVCSLESSGLFGAQLVHVSSILVLAWHQHHHLG